MQAKKQQLELDVEKTDWFKIGKGEHQGCILPPAYLTYIQSTLYKILGWIKYKLKSILPGEIATISDMELTPP